MRPRAAVFGTLGVLASGVGIGLLFAPEPVRTIGPVDGAVTALSAVETTTVVFVTGVLVLAALAVTARSPSGSSDRTPSRGTVRFERVSASPPERATASQQSVTAATRDHDIRQAIEEGGAAFEDVRSLLSETAATVYAEQLGISVSGAAEDVARGDWTDDPVAARFLADDLPTPLSMRLRRWLIPERERERRIERTVAAIERVSGR